MRGHTTRRPRRLATNRRIMKISRADTIRAEAGKQSRTEAAQKPHREQKTNRRKQGGIDPGPVPFDLPAVTAQIFSRRLRTRDEHGRTGTTNHRGTTGERGRRWPRSTPKTSRKRETKQRDEQRTNSEKEGGRGTPKGGACDLQRRIAQKNTRYKTTCSPCQYFRVQYFREGRREAERKKTKRRRTGGKLDRAPRSLCVVLATLCRSRRGNDTRRHKRALQALTEQNRPPRPPSAILF